MCTILLDRLVTSRSPPSPPPPVVLSLFFFEPSSSYPFISVSFSTLSVKFTLFRPCLALARLPPTLPFTPPLCRSRYSSLSFSLALASFSLPLSFSLSRPPPPSFSPCIFLRFVSRAPSTTLRVSSSLSLSLSLLSLALRLHTVLHLVPSHSQLVRYL